MSVVEAASRFDSRHRPPTPTDPLPAVAFHPGRHHLRSNLRASTIDGAFCSIMIGMGETYIPAFILALDERDEIAAGLVAAIPMVIGALIQLITPVAVRAIGSHKRWVLGTALLQAMSLLLLPVAAWLGSSAIWLVFVAASIYWACALGTGAVWNTWVEGMVPRPIRTRFFARRVRVCQASLLVGFLAGGFGLQIARNTPWGMTAFSLVFVTAALSRLMSVLFLYLQSERRATPMVERYVTIRDLGSGRKAASSARLLAYLFAAQIGVYIAGPFYAPYMLKKLQMPYHVFAILIGITFFGKVIALPFWGQLAHMAGPKKLLWVGGIGIIPVAGLWAVTQNVYFLCLLQFIGGVTWAAYELAMFLMFLETIPREERTSVLTVYNLGNALAQVTGALIGAAFLLWQQRTTEAYLSIFVLSSVGRALALFYLARVPEIDISVHRQTPSADPIAPTQSESIH